MEKRYEKSFKWTGIPTSVGISSTKTLSKVANHIARKKSRRNILKKRY